MRLPALRPVPPSALPPVLGGRRRPVLGRFGRRCAKHRRAVLGLAGAATLLLGIAASGLSGRLSNGGYTAAGTQSARADRLLARRFHTRPPDLVLLVSPNAPVDDARVAERGRRLAGRIAGRPGVTGVRSYWSPHSSDLRSTDRRSALMAVTLSGGDARATRTAERLVPRAAALARPWRLSATGPAWGNVQFIRQGQHDQRRAELIVVPLVVLVLLAAFGSAYAAMVPAIVGAVAVIGTLALMRLLTHAMAVSVLAPNLATAIGFGLAIDYGLFLVTRFREELARGATVTAAVDLAMRTAGRTVLFSAVTVLAALCGLLLVPLQSLRSLACAAMTVVIMAAAAALLVVPALLATIGTRIDRYDAFARLRRAVPADSARTARPGGLRPVLTGMTVVCTLGLVTMSLARMGPASPNRLRPPALSRLVLGRAGLNRGVASRAVLWFPSVLRAARPPRGAPRPSRLRRTA
ncbi:MMPL family transporter, partial [Actinomadura fibrosa]